MVQPHRFMAGVPGFVVGLIAVPLLFSPSRVVAQVERKMTELGFTGGFHSIGESGGGEREEVFVLSAEAGSFVTPHHQLGVRVGLEKFEGEDASGVLAAFYSAHANPHEHAVDFLTVSLGLTNGLPFVGPLLGRIGETKFQVGLGGGVKAFVAAGMAIRIEYRYDRIFFEGSDFDRHNLLVGLSGFLKAKRPQ